MMLFEKLNFAVGGNILFSFLAYLAGFLSKVKVPKPGKLTVPVSSNIFLNIRAISIPTYIKILVYLKFYCDNSAKYKDTCDLY